MFSKPNYTQTPNEFFDEIAKTLKEGELRVLLVVMRQTFGWGNKQWDRISITQLMDKTGMKRDAVVRSTKSLVEKKLVTKHKEGIAGQEECWYSLVVENPTEFSNPIDDSNNYYQSSKKTPPSLFRRPTKETTTKEKERREEAQAPQPSFFHFKRIKMTQAKIENLLADFGPEKVDQIMERLNEYADINPKRFKQYACHAAVIRKWIREDQEKSKTQNNTWNQKNQNNYDLVEKTIGQIGKISNMELVSEGVLFYGGEGQILLKYTDIDFKKRFLSRLEKMGYKLESK